MVETETWKKFKSKTRDQDLKKFSRPRSRLGEFVRDRDETSRPEILEAKLIRIDYWQLFSCTVKPRLSNASVLDQIGFRTINLRFLRFRLRTKIRITTKPQEAERTRMRHDAAYVGFFLTIFGVTKLLYFFYCFISNFCKFFQNFSYCTAS